MDETIRELEGYEYQETYALGKWYVLDGYCLLRVKAGGDPHKVEDRIAFMEKSMRIRIKSMHFSLEDPKTKSCTGSDERDAWLSLGRGSVYEEKYNDYDEELLLKADAMLNLIYG